MKKLITAFFLNLFILSSYGQSKKDDLKKMIDSSITYMDVYHNADSLKNNIYLLNENNEPYIYESSDAKFKYFDIYENKNKSLLKKGIDVWKIISILDGNKCIIKIIDFKVKYSNNTYNFINRGGGTVKFEYVCDKNDWILLEAKWKGI